MQVDFDSGNRFLKAVFPIAASPIGLVDSAFYANTGIPKQ